MQRLLEKFEDMVDRFAIRTGLDISLMRRGLYPIPGPYHFNIRQPGFSPLELDLIPASLAQIYTRSADTLLLTGTLSNIEDHARSFGDYEQLLSYARRNPCLFRKIAGHESTITYSTDEFYTNPSFPVSFFVNKSIGEYQALPFMMKLILQEQRLLDLRRYLAGSDDLRESAKILIDYSINHEKLNIVNHKLEALEPKNKKRNGRVSKKMQCLLEHRQRLNQQMQGFTENDLRYGQLALYFLSDIDTAESDNIRRWVDTHIEYEVYRGLFSSGISKVHDLQAAKNDVDMALQYAPLSRPNCAFIEKIYNNRRMVIKELLSRRQGNTVEVSQGKKKRKRHLLNINGKASKLLSFEEFEQNHLQVLVSLGLDVRCEGDEYNITFPPLGRYVQTELDFKQTAQTMPMDDKAFSPLNPKDDSLVGSRTNTISLYGSAFFNATLGTGLGLIKALPIIGQFARYIKPKAMRVDNEARMISFRAKSGFLRLAKYNRDIFTDKLYDFSDDDIIAERLAHRSIQDKTHFSSGFTLNEENKRHSLESLIELSDGTEFIKNTIITAATLFAIEKGIDLDKALDLPNYITIFPIMFATSWISFSGGYDKILNGLGNAGKYIYRKIAPNREK